MFNNFVISEREHWNWKIEQKWSKITTFQTYFISCLVLAEKSHWTHFWGLVSSGPEILLYALFLALIFGDSCLVPTVKSLIFRNLPISLRFLFYSDVSKQTESNLRQAPHLLIIMVFEIICSWYKLKISCSQFLTTVFGHIWLTQVVSFWRIFNGKLIIRPKFLVSFHRNYKNNSNFRRRKERIIDVRRKYFGVSKP